MIRRALLLAIPALVVELVLRFFWSFVKAVTASPRILIEPGTLPFVLALVSPVTLILFLVALYQELTGHASQSRRQVGAFAAAGGMAVGVGLMAWQLHANAVALSSLPPQIRAQLPAATPDVSVQWVRAIFRSIIPALIWIGFLLVFWRDIAPLGRKWTRRLAFVLCLFTTAQLVNQIDRFLSGMHRHFADWPGRAVTLLQTQAQTQGGNATLTLAVHLIAACGSVRAGAPMQLSGTAKSYCLNESTIVDQRDIGWAEFDQDAYDKSTILVTLNDDAARRFRQVTGNSIGLLIGVVFNGQLVSVAQIKDRVERLWIGGLAHDVADMVVETFQRRRPVLTFWNLVILPVWNLVILPAVLLAASATLPWFLFSVWRMGPAPELAGGTVAQ